jgi:endonuclease/exonuclease/phosphatase family metal-dependent hydrolase
MKSFFKTVWLILCIALIIVYIVSSLSSFIPPASFSYVSLLSIGFLYILIVFMLFCFINFFIKRRLGYIMLFILPIGYFNVMSTFALRVETGWRQQKNASTLRVMTWNVQGFVNYTHKERSAYISNRKEMLAAILDYNPDVLCFQEYKNIENAKRRISIRRQLDSLGYKYFFCSNDFTGGLLKNPLAHIEEGVAIYSKLPLIDSARININPDRNENLVYADISFHNKPLRIFTAHLQSFELYPDTAQGKYGDDNIYEIAYEKRRATQYKIRETEVKHQQEVSVIRRAIDRSPYPVIYCGDLNTTPASYNYRYLKGNNLQDAFLAKGSGIGNTFYKLGPALRIDVCFADTALQVLQCKREKKKLSDHYPVITDIAWKH